MNKDIYDNYVKKIVSCGNMTSAAKQVGISQPALSQGITLLEKELSFKIFNRKANPITLTDEGRLYYEYILRLDTLSINFWKQMDACKENGENKVSIGASAVYAESILIDCVSKIVSKYPECEIQIMTGTIEQLIQWADEGIIDLFISTSKDLPDNFVIKELFKEKMKLCVPEYSSANAKLQDGIDYEILQDSCFIQLNDEYPLQMMINEYFNRIGFRPKYKILVDQVSIAVRLVERGVGVCFASEKAITDKKVCSYPVDIRERNIYIAYDKDLYITRAFHRVIDSFEI